MPEVVIGNLVVVVAERYFYHDMALAISLGWWKRLKTCFAPNSLILYLNLTR